MAHCDAIRPREIEDCLRLHAGWILLADENYFVGPLPARRIVRQSVRGSQVHSQHGFLVQTPRAFYCFWLNIFGDVPPEEVAKIREVVESFTLLPD